MSKNMINKSTQLALGLIAIIALGGLGAGTKAAAALSRSDTTAVATGGADGATTAAGGALSGSEAYEAEEPIAHDGASKEAAIDGAVATGHKALPGCDVATAHPIKLDTDDRCAAASGCGAVRAKIEVMPSNALDDIALATVSSDAVATYASCDKPPIMCEYGDGKVANLDELAIAAIPSALAVDNAEGWADANCRATGPGTAGATVEVLASAARQEIATGESEALQVRADKDEAEACGAKTA